MHDMVRKRIVFLDRNLVGEEGSEKKNNEVYLKIIIKIDA